MIIRAPQLKAAWQHAKLMGEQIGGALDNGHDGENGEVVELLLAAWEAYIQQFGDTLDPARTYVADGFRVGISKVNPRLELVVTS